MEKQQILEKLTEEKEYFRIEFLEKQKQNKKEFAEKIFTDLINEFEKSEFAMNRKGNNLEFTGIQEKYLIELTTDIDSNPADPLIFLIKKLDEDKKITEFLVRPFKNSSFPNPDFSALASNPYKGKDSLDIEIEEEQKNIDFFKRYINDRISFEDYVYVCQDKNTKETSKECETIHDLMKLIKRK
jgi:hypothetical protein